MLEIAVTVYSSVLTQKWSTVIWILLKTFFNTCLLLLLLKSNLIWTRTDLEQTSRCDDFYSWCVYRFTIYFIIFFGYEIMYSFDLIDQLQNIQELQTNEFWAINMKRKMNKKHSFILVKYKFIQCMVISSRALYFSNDPYVRVHV